jgi:hypothetical protein
MSDLTKKVCESIFRKELDSFIDNDNRLKLLKLFSELPDNFILLSASSSGFHHPAYANKKPYGLVLHTRSVVDILESLLETRKDIDDVYMQDLIISAIIHDMTKYCGNDKSERVSYTHDQTIVQLAYICGFSENVQKMVSCHHGRYNSSEKNIIELFPDKQQNPLLYEACWLLHYADLIASRKYININHDHWIRYLDEITGFGYVPKIIENNF